MSGKPRSAYQKPGRPRPPQPTAAERMERKRQAKAQPKVDYYLAQKAKALSYDYGQIPEEHRELVQRAALDIRTRSRRMVDDAIQIGEQLLAVKELLPHGQFADWWQTEFDFGTRSIQEMMNMARRFAGKSAIIAHLTQTTARLLAAPSIPDEAVDAVIAKAQAHGSPLPVAEVRRIVAPYKPPRPPKQLPPPPVPQLTGPAPDTEPDAIDAEYTVLAAPLAFAEWLASMPSDLTIRDHLAILELAKGSATKLRNVRPSLYNAVSNVMLLWSQLITAVEKELRK